MIPPELDPWPVPPCPHGAWYDGSGTDVALSWEVATLVELCMLDADGREQRVELVEQDADVWRCFLPDVAPGQRYGDRVHGPYEPHRGHCCNPDELLLDPCADRYEQSGHRPHAGIDVVTAHDGLALHDLSGCNDTHDELRPRPAAAVREVL